MTFMRSLALAAILATSSTLAWGQGSGAPGNWSNILLREGATSAPPCRYLEIEQRDYKLARGFNSEISGTYGRMVFKIPLLFMESSCRLPGADGPQSFPMRTDVWAVRGKIDSAGVVKLTASYAECMGDCSDGRQADQRFETSLKVSGEKLYDLGSGAPKDLLIFVREDVKQLDEESATGALRPLLDPLLQNDCNGFYARSTDASVRRNAPADVFCRVTTPFASILGGVVHDRPLQSFRVSLGVLRPATPAIRYLVDGDVLVIRAFVLSEAGENLPVVAVLRRAPTGEWLFLDFP